MKIADIQPALFERFKHILRVNKLSHAYLFSGGFGSLIWLFGLVRPFFVKIYRTIYLVRIAVTVV